MSKHPPLGDAGAEFSDDRRFRFLLWRRWRDGGLAHFCMLNPSIADETKLDPTLRRCKGFAEQWGMGGMVITNLYPLVATHPKELLKTDDRRGPLDGFYYRNDAWIANAAEWADVTVVGWGTNVKNPKIGGVVPYVYHSLLKKHSPKCLRTTKMGYPEHPLYLPFGCELKDWKVK